MKTLTQLRRTRKRVSVNKFIPVKTSENSYWYHNSTDINVQVCEDQISEACEKSPWSFDDITYPFNIAKPEVLPWRSGKTIHMVPELILLCMYDFDELISALLPSGFRATQRINLGDSINQSSLILPNPNRVAEGITKDGRHSACCRDAVGKRAYLIVELTHQGLSADRQAGVIRHLQELHHGQLQLIVRTQGLLLRLGLNPLVQIAKIGSSWYRQLSLALTQFSGGRRSQQEYQMGYAERLVRFRNVYTGIEGYEHRKISIRCFTSSIKRDC